MGLTANVLASGPGWRVQDVVCTFGPHDRPFAERHHGVCVAAVTEGTFQYRSTLGSAVLAPGALLLGTDRHAFECRHEHGTGDRCLSFRLTPEFLEGVVAAIPGVRRAVFSAPLLPPHSGLLPIIAPPKPRAGTLTRRHSRKWRCVSPARSQRCWRERRDGRRRRAAVTSGRLPPRCAGSKRRPTSRCRSPIW